MYSKNNDEDFVINDEYVIRRLLPDYVSLYNIELNSGHFEILRIADNTNARKIVGNKLYGTFDEYSREYADHFILKEEQKEFLEWHNCKNMKKRLRKTDKLTYHYHSVSKEGKDSYYEAYAVKGKVDKQTHTFQIFLGYRNVDSILYKEKAIQERLQRALEETNLRNEIIAAIAKTYQYISRIDIEADWYEVIANRNSDQLSYAESGNVSVNYKKQCDLAIAREYQEAFNRFTDLTTLPERMAQEETIVMEYRMKDGNWHKLRFIEKKRDEQGRLTHVICAIRSISDAKRREQSLISQVAEAKKESEIKTRFLSNMSHDIRTPMNGIIGMIKLANRYPDDLEVQQKCRDNIMMSAKHLVSLMNDILDLNKLESGDVVDEELSFDLTGLLNRANTQMQMMAEKKGVTYVVDWDKFNLTQMNLIGNPVYLERLLSAIIDNAVKFTEPGGSVHVWCAQKETTDNRVICEFFCTDTGIGMSEEFLAHMYDVFSQEHESSRSSYEGTGLGLAIAKKLTEKLGGTIEIQSKKGVGTTVLMTVPFKIGQNEAVEKTCDIDQIELKGIHALVAEDNELNMEIIRFMLEDQQICVECAADGLETVDKFEQSEPGYYDVILLDIMMPNMNGWDAARKIRAMQRPDAAYIPIIAMSANSFADDIIYSRISGIDEHIAKPLDTDRLMDTIREGLAKRKRDGENGE